MTGQFIPIHWFDVLLVCVQYDLAHLICKCSDESFNRIRVGGHKHFMLVVLCCVVCLFVCCWCTWVSSFRSHQWLTEEEFLLSHTLSLSRERLSHVRLVAAAAVFTVKIFSSLRSLTWGSSVWCDARSASFAPPELPQWRAEHLMSLILTGRSWSQWLWTCWW